MDIYRSVYLLQIELIVSCFYGIVALQQDIDTNINNNTTRLVREKRSQSDESNLYEKRITALYINGDRSINKTIHQDNSSGNEDHSGESKKIKIKEILEEFSSNQEIIPNLFNATTALDDGISKTLLQNEMNKRDQDDLVTRTNHARNIQDTKDNLDNSVNQKLKNTNYYTAESDDSALGVEGGVKQDNWCRAVYEPIMNSARNKYSNNKNPTSTPSSVDVLMPSMKSFTNSSLQNDSNEENGCDSKEGDCIAPHMILHEVLVDEDIDEYDEAYSYEEVYGDFYYYDNDYYINDHSNQELPESREYSCCRSHGVSEECLPLCNGIKVFHCNQLCVYMFEHIAKSCLQDRSELYSNKHLPPYKDHSNGFLSK